MPITPHANGEPLLKRSSSHSHSFPVRNDSACLDKMFFRFNNPFCLFANSASYPKFTKITYIASPGLEEFWKTEILFQSLNSASFTGFLLKRKSICCLVLQMVTVVLLLPTSSKDNLLNDDTYQ